MIKIATLISESQKVKGKKSLQYSYPAYKYTYDGVPFKLWAASSREWYISFDDIYFVGEHDHARHYTTKKQALDNAINYIKKK